MVQHILEMLLDSPGFANYKHRSDPLLKLPKPVNPLPHGEGAVVNAHMLATVLIDEKDYAGNAKLVPGTVAEHCQLKSKKKNC